MLFLSCSGSEYSQLVKREMAKGVIHDSLLFDMRFGQHKQEFFQQCWQLNQKGVITNGPGNKTVKHVLPQKVEDAASSLTLLFFGDFNEKDIMTGMDLQFYYNAWSIWNKKLQSDQLIPVVMDSLNKWYPGNDFIKVPLKKDSAEIFVKVDGNRRITIKPLDDDRIVKAKIDDLRYVLEKE
ncbi:MAG: hypothetical protein Mars2KO_30640 [Maribacter sp.]